MKKKLRIAIFMSLLFISIGYASISISLEIESLISLEFNTDDFQVYVSRVMQDGKNISSNISEAGNSFTFIAYPESQVLTYRVKNLSQNYDAYVTLACTNSEGLSLNINHVGTISAQTIETRNIEISGGNNEEIVCTLDIDTIERTENAGNNCCDNSSSITFEPEDQNWNVATVEDALNYLRARS